VDALDAAEAVIAPELRDAVLGVDRV